VLPAISVWQLGSDMAEILRESEKMSMSTSKSNGRKAEKAAA
jgi:hypothetical protein